MCHISLTTAKRIEAYSVPSSKGCEFQEQGTGTCWAQKESLYSASSHDRGHPKVRQSELSRESLFLQVCSHVGNAAFQGAMPSWLITSQTPHYSELLLHCGQTFWQDFVSDTYKSPLMFHILCMYFPIVISIFIKFLYCFLCFIFL